VHCVAEDVLHPAAVAASAAPTDTKKTSERTIADRIGPSDAANARWHSGSIGRRGFGCRAVARNQVQARPASRRGRRTHAVASEAALVSRRAPSTSVGPYASGYGTPSDARMRRVWPGTPVKNMSAPTEITGAGVAAGRVCRRDGSAWALEGDDGRAPWMRPLRQLRPARRYRAHDGRQRLATIEQSFVASVMNVAIESPRR
jgi:hypothetical protein